MIEYTDEELYELAQGTAHQVAVTRNGTFLNTPDLAQLKDKSKAILLTELTDRVKAAKAGNDPEEKAKKAAAAAEAKAMADAEKAAKAAIAKAKKEDAAAEAKAKKEAANAAKETQK